MRLLMSATLLVLLSAAASAQTAPPAMPDTAQPPAPGKAGTPSAANTPAHHRRMTLKQRFDEANTTHDGHLTPDQARAGHLRFVATHFDEIDKTHQGTVTLDQIHAYSRARRAAAHAAHPAASTVQN